MASLDQLNQFKQIRDQEIAEYQLNIDNFTRAVSKIDLEYSNNQDMLDFKNHLLQLLADNKREQLKSIIMRDVLVDQISELEES